MVFHLNFNWNSNGVSPIGVSQNGGSPIGVSQSRGSPIGGSSVEGSPIRDSQSPIRESSIGVSQKIGEVQL